MSVRQSGFPSGLLMVASLVALFVVLPSAQAGEADAAKIEFFEKRVRPLLIR